MDMKVLMTPNCFQTLPSLIIIQSYGIYHSPIWVSYLVTHKMTHKLRISLSLLRQLLYWLLTFKGTTKDGYLLYLYVYPTFPFVIRSKKTEAYQ